MISTQQLATDFKGHRDLAGRPGLRRRADRLRRRHRPAARRDRPGRGRGRRGPRSSLSRARPGWSSPCAAAATAARATACPTAGWCSTCGHARARDRRGRPHRLGRDGPDGRRVHDRGRGPRPRHRLRRRRLGGDRRDHAGRRRRFPRAQARPDDRPPAGRRRGDRGRRARARGRRDPSGPLLGHPRRRRQLRRRDPLQVPPPRGRHDRGRPAVPPGDPRRDRGLHGRRAGRAGGALGDRQRHARAADAVPAGGASRPAGRDGPDGVRRRRSTMASVPSRRSGSSRPR